MDKKELTQERLKELLNYDKLTGIFTWKERNTIKKGSGCNTWNSRFSGKECGHINPKGYMQMSIDKKVYSSHRLAWLYVYGCFPKDQIDHINGIKYDNSICNLREATNSENQQNQRKAQSNNKSTGLLGSYMYKNKNITKKYRAQIRYDNKIKFIGSFDTAIEAHEAYLIAKKQYHEYSMI